MSPARGERPHSAQVRSSAIVSGSCIPFVIGASRLFLPLAANHLIEGFAATVGLGFLASPDTPRSSLDVVALGVLLERVALFVPLARGSMLAVDGFHEQRLVVQRWLTCERRHEVAELGTWHEHSHYRRSSVRDKIKRGRLALDFLISHTSRHFAARELRSDVRELDHEVDVATTAAARLHRECEALGEEAGLETE